MTEASIKTVKLPLVTPEQEVREELGRLFKDFRWVYDETGKRMPSLPRHRVKRKTDSVYYHWVREFRREGKIDLPAMVAQEAVQKARESYASMLSNKNYDEIPRSRKEVARFHNQCFHFERFGNLFFLSIPVKAGRKDNRVLLPITQNDYSYGFLKQITANGLDYGSAELKRYGELFSFNLTVKREVEIHDPTVPIGVDFGIRNIAVACAWSKGKPHIKLWSGKRARHKRIKFLKKIGKYQQKRILKKVWTTKGKYRRYMQTKNHQVSREIIHFASQFFQPYIVIEELHKFRKQNDWTFAELRQFIEYKALEQGIPVVAVDPKNTSNRCNKCGYISPENREGIYFKCQKCGYQVNSDVNAAINLSRTK